jgi:hypothetical protein
VPRPDPHPPLDLYRHEVEDMMDEGVGFAEVEAWIEASELETDDKAALWLFAWSLEAPQFKRARERPALRLVTTHPRLEFGGAVVP